MDTYPSLQSSSEFLKLLEYFQNVWSTLHTDVQDLAERTSFAVCVLGKCGGILHEAYVGEETEKSQIFQQNAYNKCVVLYQHPDSVSSFQHADTEADPPIYGGGIRLSSGEFLEISGLPPLWDEAFCVGCASQTGVLSDDDAKDITAVSNNLNVPAVMKTVSN